MSGNSVSPVPFDRDYRASGILLHATSLPSSYGIGDLGPPAISWIHRLAEAGQSWWQSLPLGPTGYGNSPYQALSSFAGNALLISPKWLVEDELLTERECEHPQFSVNAVDYDAIIPFKYRLFAMAWIASERVLVLTFVRTMRNFSMITIRGCRITLSSAH